MESQEKAKEIYDKMKGFRVKNTHRKKCAMHLVDELIKSHEYWETEQDECFVFWREVKEELSKL